MRISDAASKENGCKARSVLSDCSVGNNIYAFQVISVSFNVSHISKYLDLRLLYLLCS